MCEGTRVLHYARGRMLYQDLEEPEDWHAAARAGRGRAQPADRGASLHLGSAGELAAGITWLAGFWPRQLAVLCCTLCDLFQQR
jgi:hypothetical protein